MPSADFIIRTGDFIQISMNPPESYPTLAAPIPLVGSGTTVNAVAMAICLEGDETPQLLLAPQPYQSPTFYTTPGMGTVTIKLGSSNKTAKTKNGKAILIKGQPFNAEFNVTVPATYVNEASGVTTTDPVSKKTGTVQFITTNATVKAS
ncbi:hypothetical protein [Candidatus Uabimicrobium amorphum]|uniref:Uncharacterized protein n=1 Tax=Uabimicrobium amorphum TaxID=2596890 RepID=A0A5S9IHY9_UABAM|nr:hypothetical protein [Candidatus Uabimicrobium amorphum]BBM81917.1 hypothetical protein UABAM_00259 [Candidatus Uabimicrobium amorphum]